MVPKKGKDGRISVSQTKEEMQRKVNILFCHLCLLNVVALLCIKLFSMQCLSNKYCELFCK